MVQSFKGSLRREKFNTQDHGGFAHEKNACNIFTREKKVFSLSHVPKNHHTLLRASRFKTRPERGSLYDLSLQSYVNFFSPTYTPRYTFKQSSCVIVSFFRISTYFTFTFFILLFLEFNSISFILFNFNFMLCDE